MAAFGVDSAERFNGNIVCAKDGAKLNDDDCKSFLEFTNTRSFRQIFTNTLG